jgi:ribosomal protein L7/L12
VIEEIKEAMQDGKLRPGDLDAAERFFRFMANTVNEIKAEMFLLQDPVEVEVSKLLKQKKKIPAIKLLREKNVGMGLKSAVEQAKALAAKVGIEW